MAEDFVEPMKIEFGDWMTPVTKSRIEIAEVCYLPNHDWDTPDLKETLENSIAGQPQKNDLIIRVFDHDRNAYFRIEFDHIEAFRVLDEGGLSEIWSAASSENRKVPSTLKVRNHSWTKESPVSFHMGTRENWAYFVATENDCVEILSKYDPTVSQE